MQDPSETHEPVPSAQTSLADWLACCLADDVRPPAGTLPVDEADAEGVLPWLGWRLQASGALATLPAAQQKDLRHALRHWSLMHLDSEAELARLAQSAAKRGVRVIAFKGHSVARTLYPNPACRPTSDFDLLVDPAQVSAAQAWLTEMGYMPTQQFVGTHWRAAQNWAFGEAGAARFHADLHWDCSNRMYFRRRLPFAAIWEASRHVASGDTPLRVPCPVDDLILACVHLAAFKPGLHVKLVWLLDIYLLMAALNADEIPLLVERAGRARALEACLEFGQRAAALGDPRQPQGVIEALRDAASERRWRGYQRTLRWRSWDLACYWGRLSLIDKARFIGDMLRRVTVR